MALRINDMMRSTKGHKKEILRELKRLNRLAYEQYFMAPGYLFGHTFKAKYKALQRSTIWKQAKALLREYLEDNICPVCKKEQDDWLLHHAQYVNEEIFTPDFVMFIHKRCHTKDLREI